MQHLAKYIVMVNHGLTKHMTIKNKYVMSKHANMSTLTAEFCTSSTFSHGYGKDVT